MYLCWFYQLENAGVPVAEVKLKAKTPGKTKLTVLNFREWEVEYVKPILEEVSYSLTVPADFTVRGLTAEEARNKIIQNAYLLPYPIRMEKNVTWLHIDTLPQHSITEKIHLF